MTTAVRGALVAVLVAILVLPLRANAEAPTYCAPGQAPQYVLGFADLKVYVGDDMGEPLTCEFPDPNGTGDVHQRTSKGLAFWRKSTNTPTFTNGWYHWGRTPAGWTEWTGESIDPPGTTAPAPTPSPTPSPAPPTATPVRPAAFPSPTPEIISEPIYRGDPRTVAFQPSDLGGTWETLAEDASRIHAGYFRKLLGTRNPLTHDLSSTVVFVEVYVLPGVPEAQLVWARFATPRLEGARTVTPPNIADEQYTELGQGYLLVQARARNVILSTTLVSPDTPNYSPYDLLVDKVRLMANRVDAQAR